VLLLLLLLLLVVMLVVVMLLLPMLLPVASSEWSRKLRTQCGSACRQTHQIDEETEVKENSGSSHFFNKPVKPQKPSRGVIWPTRV
jgi:hypothetical protein